MGVCGEGSKAVCGCSGGGAVVGRCGGSSCQAVGGSRRASTGCSSRCRAGATQCALAHLPRRRWPQRRVMPTPLRAKDPMQEVEHGVSHRGVATRAARRMCTPRAQAGPKRQWCGAAGGTHGWHPSRVLPSPPSAARKRSRTSSSISRSSIQFLSVRARALRYQTAWNQQQQEQRQLAQDN